MDSRKTRDEAMRAGRIRLRVVLELDAKAKGFNRRKFNQAVAAAMADVVRSADDAEPKKITIEEVKRK